MDDISYKRIERNLKIAENKRTQLWNRDYILKPDEVYRIVMELITWLDNCNEWFYYNYDKYEELRDTNEEICNLIRGIRQAFNSFKHNMDIITVEGRKHIEFYDDILNRSFVIEQIVWAPYQVIKTKKEDYKLKKGYIEYLEGKSVLQTIDKVLDFLFDCYNKMLYPEDEEDNAIE